MNNLRQALDFLETDGPEIVREAGDRQALNPIIVAARSVLGFPSPEAVEAARQAAGQDRKGFLLLNTDQARAALVAAATTDFEKDADGD